MLALRYHIANQLLLTRSILPRQYHDLADRLMAAQHRFDLARFNPEPPDLNLVVRPAEEV